MSEQAQKTGQILITWMVIVMILRINSYFMISESAAVTRVFKTGLRGALTGICFLWYRNLNNSDEPTRFVVRNVLGLGLYLGYLLLGVASVMWSSDRFWSTLQLAMDFECVFFVWFFMKVLLIFNDQKRFSMRTSLSFIIWTSCSWVALGFLIGYFVNPDLFLRGTHGGEVQRLGGFIINPNELGMLLVVGSGCLYVHMMRTLKVTFWKILGWLLMLIALLLTQSRSSLISFFLTTLYFVFASKRAKLIIPTIVIGTLAAPVIFMTIFVKEGDVGEVMSMTGRLPFWSDLLTYGFPERTMWGFGFMRIHYHERFPSIHGFPGAMTHNTFVQVILNLGVAGALTCFFQMLFVFRSVMRQPDPMLKHTFAGIFFGIFVNSLTEFGIFGDANYGIMWWLFAIYINVLSADPKPVKQKYVPIYGLHAPR